MDSDIIFPRGGRVNKRVKKGESSSLKGKSISKNTDRYKYRIFGMKTLKVGINVLGKIRRIGTRDIVIGLPNHLTGYLSVDGISETLKSRLLVDKNIGWKLWFVEGELIVVQVTSVEKKGMNRSSRIELSCCPGIVNSRICRKDLFLGLRLVMEVVSEEDFGYILKCNDRIDSIFFMSRTKTGVNLDMGQVIRVKIIEIEEIVIKVEMSTIQGLVAEYDRINYTNIIPGDTVKFRVSRVIEGVGLVVSFGNSGLQGFIDVFGLPVVVGKDGMPLELKGIYSPVRREGLIRDMTGTVICVDDQMQSIRLSALEIVDTKKCRHSIGDIIRNIRVVRKFTKYGILVEIDKGVHGFVHINRLGDKCLDDIRSTVDEARIVDIDPFDGQIHMTLDRRDLEEKYFRYQDVEVGEIVNGKVIKIESFGTIVEISQDIRAICPVFHWTENHKVEVKGDSIGHRDICVPPCPFVVGRSYRFRVLSVDAKIGRVMLTFKHTMVNSKLPVLDDVSKLEDSVYRNENKFHGFAISIRTTGAVIGFYNNASGYLSQIEPPLRIGQTVVVKCSKYTLGRIKLTLSTEKPGESKLAAKCDETSPLSILRDIQNDSRVETLSMQAQDSNMKVDMRCIELTDSMDSNREETPNIEHYEKCVLEQPASSHCWIGYMAYLVSIGDRNQVRCVAGRAINSIPSHMENERLHVWSAWVSFEWDNMIDVMNDEAAESFHQVLKEALSRSDQKKIYTVAWDLMMETIENGNEKQRNIAKIQILQIEKQFRQKHYMSCQLWTKIWKLHSLIDGDSAKAFQDAVTSLPRHKHIKYIQQIALLEYQTSHLEHGRNLFEKLLSEHPKRLDIWFVYIQAEIKILSSEAQMESVEMIRHLIERAIAIGFSAKRTKSIFKLYFQFETRFGTGKSIKRVTDAASDYVQRLNLTNSTPRS